MRLRRKRVEAATRQGVNGAETDTGAAYGSRSVGRLALMARLARIGDNLAKRLAALSAREQMLLAAGVATLLLALVVGLGVLPAWRSLQQGPARQQVANAQMARVVQLEAQAQALKARPVWSASEAAARLQASSARLATPELLQLSVSAQQANAELRALPADTLAAWLTAAREQAHAVPVTAKLTRETAAGAEGADRWSGTLVMRLPP